LLTVYPLLGNREVGYQAASTVLQVLWIPVLVELGRAFGLPARKAGAAVLLVAASGWTPVNVVYTWPKLLAGEYGLLALLLVVRRAIVPGVDVLLAAVATGLAYLSHGTAGYFVAGLVALAFVRRGLRVVGGVRTAAVAGAALVVLVAPWSGYQHWYDPPGDRLLKWHLPDAPSVDDPRSLGAALEDAYLRTPVADVLMYKAHNLWLTVWVPKRLGSFVGVAVWADEGWRGRLRYEELTSLLWSMGLLGFLAPLAMGPSRRRTLLPVLVVTAATWLIWCALQYGRGGSAAFLHHGPAALPLLLGWIGAVVLVTSARPAVRAVGALGQVALFALLWVSTPPPATGLGSAPSPAGSALARGVLLAVAAAAAVALVARAEEETRATIG